MSESNGYANLEAVQARQGKRRVKDFEWSNIGTLELHSAMAGEWMKIDAIRQRAILAAQSGKKKEHDAATQEYVLQVCYLVPFNKADHSNFFTPANKDLILSLDPALVDQLVTACVDHAGFDEVSLGDTQKNLPTTSGSSSPTG